MIGWTEHDIWYYGAEYSNTYKVAHPDNLWNKYYTSSRYVKEFREQYGEPDVVEVRKTFNSREDAKAWESKVLRRIDAVKSDRWLNKNDGGKNFDIVSQPEEANEKRRQKLKGVPKRNKEKYIRYGIKNNMYGRKHSEEWRDNHSTMMKGENNPMFGTTFMWINNGVTNKRHNPDYEIPMGFMKGKTQRIVS